MSFNGNDLARALFKEDKLDEIFKIVGEYRQIKVSIIKSISEGNLKGLSEGLKALGKYIKQYEKDSRVSEYIGDIKPIYKGLREYGKAKKETALFEGALAIYAQEEALSRTRKEVSDTQHSHF